MDGFRVDISALTQSGADFKRLGGELANVSRRLASLRKLLLGQEFPTLSSTMALIESAEKLLAKSSDESLDYGDMCEEISETYEMAERKVLSMVNALGTILAGGFDGTTATTSGAVSSSPRADITAATPVLMSSDRLQAEKWLLKRAIDELEGEVFG